MILKRLVRGSLWRAKQWLEDGVPAQSDRKFGPPPFSYHDANDFFKKIMREQKFGRPDYVWGALHGANLAKVLGIRRISFIEFGVAGGNSLVALEQAAESLQASFGIDIDVHGFDAVGGMPDTRDPRDAPNLWEPGFYPMDREKLERRLKKTKLHLGEIEQTVTAFINAKPAPVAFIAFDLCYYTSTIQAFRMFDADPSLLLPRIHCFFRNILGLTYGDHNGERLAMSEFNAAHQKRKVSKIYGLNYFLGPGVGWFVDQYYMGHIFDHPLYGNHDRLIPTQRLDLQD
jgi:hypothetical protein